MDIICGADETVGVGQLVLFVNVESVLVKGKLNMEATHTRLATILARYGMMDGSPVQEDFSVDSTGLPGESIERNGIYGRDEVTGAQSIVAVLKYPVFIVFYKISYLKN